MQITNNYPNIQTGNKQYQPNFTGFGQFTTKVKSALHINPKINLHLDLGNNKKVYEYFQSKFDKLPKDSMQKAYLSVLDADGKANPDAIMALKKICDAPKNLLSKIIQPHNNTSYTKYGLNFISELIETAKDSNKNHAVANLDFVYNLLTTHSTSNPDSYFNLIKISKDANGIIPKENVDLYTVLNKAKMISYYPHITNKDGIIDNYFRDYILNDINQHRGKIDENILEIIKAVAKSKDAKAVLSEVETKRKDVKTSDLKFCISHANDISGELSLENFKRLTHIAQNDPGLLKYYNIFRDNKKHIRNDNINFVRTISPKISDAKTLCEYKNVGSDSNGVVTKDFANNLDAFFRKHPKSNSSSTLIYCLNKVKNSDGSINWDYIKTFYNVRSKICHIDEKDPHSIFDKTLSVIKDKKGDIIPEFANEIRNLMGDDLFGEISYLLKASKKADDTLDKKLFDSAKNIVKSAPPKERIDISMFLASLRDKKGNFETAKFQVLENIEAAGIKSNILQISKALLNPDGTSSKKGLDFIHHLRKNSHHQIEDDLAYIINLCRDNTGYLNSENIECVKSIQALKPHVDLPTLIKIVRSKTGEINKSKVNALNEVIKHFHGRHIDTHTLKDVIRLSTDSHGECDLDMMKLLARIRKSGGNLNAYHDLMPAFRDFAKYSHVTSYDQLNLQQKRDIMRKIKNHKTHIQDNRFRRYLNIKILPLNESDYCVTLARLSHSIGINVKPLDKKVIADFFAAMNKMSDKHSEFMKLDFDKNVPKLDLTYPLEDFQKDVWNVVKNLSYSDRTKSIDYFGFELKNKNNKFIMSGFPSADKPDGRLAKIKDQTVQDTISKLTPYVIKFTQANDVHVAHNPNLSKELTAIVKAFPEFLTTVGKPQHVTHDYTLDIHLLKVLQGVFKNPEYQKLSDSSKKQLQISALLHDLTKTAGEVDRYHPDNSAFDIYYLLDKFMMHEKDKLKIYHIIKNHAWLARYNKAQNQNFVAKDLAFELRQGDAFKLISILADADLRGIQKHDAFYKKYGADLIKAQQKINPILFDLQKTTINLPQTKIPKIDKINHKSPYVSIINKDGIKNTVINLRQGVDLKKVGFEENVSLSDLNILVHGLDNKDQAAMFQSLGLINSDALLSTSYINYGKGNWRVFRQQGFVLGVPSADIHAGYWRDFGSGYKKNKKDLFDTYLFHNDPTRTYFSNSIKHELNLSDKAYIELIRKIEDMSITELDAAFPNVAKAYRRIFTKMDVSKRSFGRNYNEILVSRPKIQALFCYGQHPDNLSAYLRRYAEKNNIPILVFN